MFKKVASPVFGIVEDMTYFLCLPLCGRSEISSHHVADKKQSGSARSFMGYWISRPARPPTVEAITVSEPDNPQVLVFRHIAGRICEKVSAHAEQRATRIVIHNTGIKRAQPKLPVSRKASGKPTMNGDPLKSDRPLAARCPTFIGLGHNTAVVSLLAKILPGPIRFAEILAIAPMYA